MAHNMFGNIIWRPYSKSDQERGWVLGAEGLSDLGAGVSETLKNLECCSHLW